jgi:hypothetical protein
MTVTVQIEIKTEIGAENENPSLYFSMCFVS